MSRLYAMLNDLERDAELTYANLTSGDLRGRRVRSAIRSKRRTRTMGIVAASTIAALGVTGTAWAVMTRDNVAPAIPTPTPSPTVSAPSEPSPTATPSPEAELTMPAFTGTVTVDQHLPSALPITPKVWNEAGPGWVLATYREEMGRWDEATKSSIDSYGPQVVYLISPQGDRYELARVVSDDAVSVVDWSPGEQLALAALGDSGTPEDRSWVTLDLVAGTVHPVSDADVAATLWTMPTGQSLERIGLFGSGSEYVRADQLRGAEPLLALPPAPTSSARGDLEAAKSTAQSLVPAGEECRTAQALPTQVVVECGTDVAEVDPGSPELLSWSPHFFVFVDNNGAGEGTVVDVRFEEQPWGTPSLRLGTDAVSDSVVTYSISPSPYDCPGPFYSASAAGVSELPGVAAVRASAEDLDQYDFEGSSGTAAYTLVSGTCSGSDLPEGLVRDDLATGAWVVLIPYPTSADVEFPEGWMFDSIVSVYVVPDWK